MPLKIEDRDSFCCVGEMTLPEGYEGKELHVYISRGKVELWLLPQDTPSDIVQAWLSERRNADRCCSS